MSVFSIGFLYTLHIFFATFLEHITQAPTHLLKQSQKVYLLLCLLNDVLILILDRRSNQSNIRFSSLPCLHYISDGFILFYCFIPLYKKSEDLDFTKKYTMKEIYFILKFFSYLLSRIHDGHLRLQ